MIIRYTPQISGLRLGLKAYAFFILFLPLAIIEITSIYSVTSPDYIRYKYLNYEFSALALLAFLSH